MSKSNIKNASVNKTNNNDNKTNNINNNEVEEMKKTNNINNINNINNNNDEVDKMKKTNNTNNANANSNINIFEGTKKILEKIIKQHEKIEDVSERLQAIKVDYAPFKKAHIQTKKAQEYKKPVKEVNFIIEYPDITLTQDLELKIITKTRTLLFNDWYNNHFKIDDPLVDNKPILKNNELVSFQSKIFTKISEETKNKDSQDILVTNSDLRRAGQNLFKLIIDNGEGIWGNFQVKYCLATIVQQSKDKKQAREVHRELFSKILFSAFAEGDFISRQKK